MRTLQVIFWEKMSEDTIDRAMMKPLLRERNG